MNKEENESVTNCHGLKLKAKGYNIKSIVTKEQFESLEYEVKE